MLESIKSDVTEGNGTFEQSGDSLKTLDDMQKAIEQSPVLQAIRQWENFEPGGDFESKKDAEGESWRALRDAIKTHPDYKLYSAILNCAVQHHVKEK